MQVLALVALGAYPSREEQAEVGPWVAVGAGIPCVGGDVASIQGGGLGKVGVFPIAAGPFVVPDVENGAGLRRGFGLDHGSVDLWTSRPPAATDDFLLWTICGLEIFCVLCDCGCVICGGEDGRRCG